jgi:hypothetical protein
MRTFAKHPAAETWTNQQMLGWGGLGGLTIPFSMRILDALYLIVAPNVYFHIFPPPQKSNKLPLEDTEATHMDIQLRPDLGILHRPSALQSGVLFFN